MMTRQDYMILADAMAASVMTALSRNEELKMNSPMDDPKIVMTHDEDDHLGGVNMTLKIICCYLVKDNPNFDHGKFMKAIVARARRPDELLRKYLEAVEAFTVANPKGRNMEEFKQVKAEGMALLEELQGEDDDA